MINVGFFSSWYRMQQEKKLIKKLQSDPSVQVIKGDSASDFYADGKTNNHKGEVYMDTDLATTIEKITGN